MFGLFEPQERGTLVGALWLLVSSGSACDVPDEAGAESATSESVDSKGDSGTDSSTTGDTVESSSAEDESETGSETGTEAIGLCFVESEAEISADRYHGWIDYVLVAELGEGEELCRVRFQVERRGGAAPECSDCAWTEVLQLKAAEHLVDRDDQCAASQRGLDRAAIDALMAEPFAQGFMDEFVGHESLIVEHDLGAESHWQTRAVATWDAELGRLHWRESEGFCAYTETEESVHGSPTSGS